MKQFIKKIIPDFIIKFLKRILPNKKNLFLNKLNFNYVNNVVYLGSNYGGWSFVNKENLRNKFIISAGLGEDASFDVELINKFNCKVIVVDPTPRAIDHYNQIIKNSGKKNKTSYKEGGSQEISSYNLTKIDYKNFILINRGLYEQDGLGLKFFAPPNNSHVSHSINDWQNNYKKNTSYINIETITVKKILQKFNLDFLDMIKLDIEGSEIEVLNNMIKEKIFPNQILVEFDELNKINDIATKRFYEIHTKLISENYKLIKTKSKFPDFLYVKNSYLKQ